MASMPVRPSCRWKSEMIRSGALPSSFASASRSDWAVTTRQPQLLSKPPVPSSASASSSMITMSLPRSGSGAAAPEAAAIAGASTRRHLRYRDREARALPERRGEGDGVLQHGAQAFDDGQSQPQPGLAAPLRRRNLVELAEDAALLIRRNADPAVAHIDAQRVPDAPAADDDPASRRVAHGVGDEVEQDLLEQDGIAADPRAACNHAQVQALVARSLGERRADAVQHPADGKFGDVGAHGAGIELRDVEQRVEQLVHVGDGGVDAHRETVAFGLDPSRSAAAQRTGSRRATAAAGRGSPPPGSATWTGWPPAAAACAPPPCARASRRSPAAWPPCRSAGLPAPPARRPT